MIRRVVARHDPALRALVVRTVPLHYAAGADVALDRPAHVRAGSGVVRMGSRLVIVQDDTNFFAVVDPRRGDVVAIPLPAGAGGRRQFDDARGNKDDKLDLEAIVIVPQPGTGAVVLAFGSGSTGRRESVVALRGLGAAGAAVVNEAVVAAPVVEVLEVPRFYAQLRESHAFAGSELNVEAAVYLGAAPGGRLRLFNRGNGAPRAGRAPIDATCDVPWPMLATYLASQGTADPPVPCDVMQYDLGVIGGRALSFTGATLAQAALDAERRWILYTAAAEASPDATRDGPVAGCAIGVIAEGPDGTRVRWAVLEDQAGNVFGGKVEGIVLHPEDLMRAHVVVDRDAPGQPAELCEVVLRGPWFTEA